MKNLKILVILAFGVSLTNCEKESVEVTPTTNETAQEVISPKMLSQIDAMGFSTEKAELIGDGKEIRVEGDIILTIADLENRASQNSLGQKHRKTKNLVRCWKVGDIKIKHFLSGERKTAFEEAVTIWNNNTASRVKLRYVNDRQDITIVGASDDTVKGAFADALTPTANGMPGNRIRVNLDSNRSKTFWRNIFLHEIGHTLGFDHNDDAKGRLTVVRNGNVVKVVTVINELIDGIAEDDEFSLFNSGQYPGAVEKWEWQTDFSFWDKKAIQKLYGFGDNVDCTN